MHHSLVSLIFDTTIPTSFNILVKCFLHLFLYIYGPLTLVTSFNITSYISSDMSSNLSHIQLHNLLQNV